MFGVIVARYLGIFFLCMKLFSTANAAVITKSLPVSTSIDMNKFYSERFTKVEFLPSSLNVNYVRRLGTFSPMSTSLNIETDIPDSQVRASYMTVLTDNQSQCYTASGGIVNLYDKFVDVEIDNMPFLLGDEGSVQFLSFKSSKNGYKNSTHDFKLLFSPLPKVTEQSDYILSCSGTISVRLEYTI